MSDWPVVWRLLVWLGLRDPRRGHWRSIRDWWRYGVQGGMS